jgi:hypothetical protein
MSKLDVIGTVKNKDGTTSNRYATPQHPPGETQFQPNNKEAFGMVDGEMVRLKTFKKMDWATRTLIRAIQRGYGAKSVMQKVERTLRGTDKKSDQSRVNRARPASTTAANKPAPKKGPEVVYKKK